MTALKTCSSARRRCVWCLTVTEPWLAFPALTAVVAAYADLGSIATLDRQRGPYLSLQASF